MRSFTPTNLLFLMRSVLHATNLLFLIRPCATYNQPSVSHAILYSIQQTCFSCEPVLHTTNLLFLMRPCTPYKQPSVSNAILYSIQQTSSFSCDPGTTRVSSSLRNSWMKSHVWVADDVK
jgi:hypothetical protein